MIRIKTNFYFSTNIANLNFSKTLYKFDWGTMPLPPALAKKLATRGILTENEGIIINQIC